MKSINVPFKFVNGGVAQTNNLDKIVRQQVINVLATAKGERVIELGYGSTLKSNFMFSTIESIEKADWVSDAIQDVNDYLENGKLTNIEVTHTEGSSIQVNASYSTSLAGSSTLTFNINV